MTVRFLISYRRETIRCAKAEKILPVDSHTAGRNAGTAPSGFIVSAFRRYKETAPVWGGWRRGRRLERPTQLQSLSDAIIGIKIDCLPSFRTDLPRIQATHGRAFLSFFSLSHINKPETPVRKTKCDSRLDDDDDWFIHTNLTGNICFAIKSSMK